MGYRVNPSCSCDEASFCGSSEGHSRENVVDADDAVRSGRAAVVYDGCVTLNPHPAAVLGQKTVVLGGDLTFDQHCKTKRREEITANYYFVGGPNQHLLTKECRTGLLGLVRAVSPVSQLLPVCKGTPVKPQDGVWEVRRAVAGLFFY